MEDDYFTLGPEYKKEVAFLKQQGALRINQSARGKASVIKRNKAKQKKTSKITRK